MAPQAAEALPELCAVLPWFPYAATPSTAVAAPIGPEQREQVGAGKLFVAPALRTALARWRIVGDAAEVVPVLASVFDICGGRQWFHWTAAPAVARGIAVLGPAGRPLTARLEALLDDPAQAPSAVLGLLAVADPAGPDRARLAEAALHSADTRAELRSPAMPCKRSAPPC
ncbi:hypothetical protein ACWCV9_00490 [Streptomyces sp. NPDC001606]